MKDSETSNDEDGIPLQLAAMSMNAQGSTFPFSKKSSNS